MVSEPALEGVVRQVNTIPQWLLPLWANWPLVFLGVVGITILLIMMVGVMRITPKLRIGLTRLTQKMDSLGDQLGNHRESTQQELRDLRVDVRHLSDRVVLLEDKRPEDP